jgi:replicative DNA helicase
MSTADYLGELASAEAAVQRVNLNGHGGEWSSHGSAFWESPHPLPEGQHPEFPVEELPEPLASFVKALACATQTPLALAAIMVLCVLATALAKVIAVLVRPGWVEPVNLYGVVSLASGNRKSAVVSAVGRPLRDYELAEGERLQIEIAQARSRREVAEKRLDKLKAKLANEDDRDASLVLQSDVNDLTERLLTDPDFLVPIAPRLLMDDTTPEKLAAMMTDHDGRMGVLSAEGGIFQTIGGRYSDRHADSLDLFLKAHAGDDMPIDRIGRDTKALRAPALTIGVAVQPHVLSGIAAHPGFRGTGLLARYIYGVPESTVGRRQIAPTPVAARIEERYTRLITAALHLPIEANPVSLDAQAAAVFQTFERRLEPRLGPDGDLEHIADWGSKLAGLVARLSGLFHVVLSLGDGIRPTNRAVDRETVERAIRIAEAFLIPHAKTAFALMGADPALDQARHVLRVIQTWDGFTLTRRDLHQRLRASFPKPEQLDRPLAILVEHGYLRPAPAAENRRGRKASPTYEINPLIHTRNPHNTQNAGPTRRFEDSVNSVYGSYSECAPNGHGSQNGSESTYTSVEASEADYEEVLL